MLLVSDLFCIFHFLLHSLPWYILSISETIPSLFAHMKRDLFYRSSTLVPKHVKSSCTASHIYISLSIILLFHSYLLTSLNCVNSIRLKKFHLHPLILLYTYIYVLKLTAGNTHKKIMKTNWKSARYNYTLDMKGSCAEGLFGQAGGTNGVIRS